jgi:hypothetical protein
MHMPTKFQAMHLNQREVMLLNSKGFYEGRKFNLARDHQSLKILLISHMLSKSCLF